MATPEAVALQQALETTQAEMQTMKLKMEERVVTMQQELDALKAAQATEPPPDVTTRLADILTQQSTNQTNAIVYALQASRKEQT